MPFPGVFKRYFHCGRLVVLSEYIKSTRKTGNNAVEMSQAFHDITQFECFTDLNLFKYSETSIKRTPSEVDTKPGSEIYVLYFPLKVDADTKINCLWLISIVNNLY